MDNDSSSICLICRSNKNDITIRCGHEYCESCISRMESQKNYNCPVCRQPWKEDGEGAVAYEYTSACEKNEDSSLDEAVECSEHQKPLVSWCDDCEELSCIRCLSFNHRSHNFNAVDDAIPAMKETIEGKMLAKKKIMESAMGILENRDTELSKLENEVIALLSAITKDKETSKEAHEIRSEFLLKADIVDELLTKGDSSNIACVYTKCSDIITESPKEELPKVTSDDLMLTLMNHETIAQKVAAEVQEATHKLELEHQRQLQDAKAKYQVKENLLNDEIDDLKMQNGNLITNAKSLKQEIENLEAASNCMGRNQGVPQRSQQLFDLMMLRHSISRN